MLLMGMKRGPYKKRTEKDQVIKFKVLSHGGGVQTRTLLHLILEEKFERPDHVIFADTQAEPESVYDALMEDKEKCEAAGIPFHIVTVGSLAEPGDKWGGIYVPAFTRPADGGSIGMLRRQCTHKFKIVPVRRLLRKLGATIAEPAEVWLGISTDEVSRAKPSNVKFARHRHPLLELEWSREHCLDFLRSRGIEPVKSACVFCPYRSGSEWRRIKSNPDDWASAVAFDESLRGRREGYDVFVHRAGVPLTMAPIDDDEQDGLWDDECGGHCGL